MRLFSPRQVAQTILDGFSTYRHRFVQITLGAGQRFIRSDWSAVQQSAAERIELYEASVTDVTETLKARVGTENLTTAVWQETRQLYLTMISERTDQNWLRPFSTRSLVGCFHTLYVRPIWRLSNHGSTGTATGPRPMHSHDLSIGSRGRCGL